MAIFKNLLGKGGSAKRVDLKKRFQWIGKVGQGSMSEVYRATDNQTGKLVALKILDLGKTESHASRFGKLNKPLEGEIACSLVHPHIVKTFEHGISTEGNEFLVMEFVEGHNLSYFVDTQNKVMQKNRIQFIIQLGHAIEHFHSEGWIHRDICPRNILVDNNLQIKMIDFGLVVPYAPEFCKPGNRTGTAAYMAPELIRRQKTDQRLDIFSYAVTCFEMYTREFPWPGIQTIEASRQRINTPPHHIHELAPDVDERVAQAIMKGLETEPEDRWQSITEMLQQFTNAESFAIAASLKKKKSKKKTTTRKKIRTKNKQTESKESAETQSLNEQPLVEDDVFDQFISEVTQEANDEERKVISVRKKRTRKKTVGRKDGVARKKKKKKSKQKSSSKKKKAKRNSPPENSL